MSRVNVLSIDWDYFIGCDCLTRMMKFPDGGNENLSPWLQTFVWNSRYSDLRRSTKGAESLSSIPVFDPAYKDMCKFLRSSHRKRTYATESHTMIYALVEDLFRKYDEVEVWNIDFHHDMFGGLDTKQNLNCGNWVSALHKKYGKKFIYHWVHRDDEESQKWFDLNKAEWYDRRALEDVFQVQFPYVFICRSNMWSPPHLDKKFDWLCNQSTLVSDRSYIEKDLHQPREWDEHQYDGLEMQDFANLTKEVTNYESDPYHLDGQP